MKPIKFYFISVFTIALTLNSFAQGGKLKLKWGDISNEELSMEEYSKDPTAEAVVLADVGDMFFIRKGGTLVYNINRHVRIKILKEAGFDQAEKSFDYYAEGRQEKLRRLKVQVINPDGTVTKLNNDNIFEEDINDYWKTKKFTAPNVQVGSIIEYEYNIESKRFISPREWEFQTTIPVRYAQLDFKADKSFDYIVARRNGAYIQQSLGSYWVNDVPALKEESFISNMSDYTCKLKFQLSSYETEFGMRPYLSTWKKIADLLHTSEDFGDKIYRGNYGKKLWLEIKDEVSEIEDPKMKADVIYQFVTNQIKWNEKYRLFSRRSGKAVLTDKLGSSAEINMMIIHLMQKAGLEAHPVITNPRSEGIVYSAYPFLDQFNHTFGALDLPSGETLFFDGTDENRPIGEFDLESLTGTALVIRKKEHEWVDIIPNKSSEMYMLSMEINEDNILTGNLKSKFKGIRAVNERNRVSEDEEGTFWEERMNERFPDVEVSSFSAENQEEINKDLTYSLDIKVPDAISEVNDLLYVPTNMYSRYATNPFKLKERLYPIDFGYPRTETIIYALTIPDGYQVESLPQNYVASTPNKEISYRYMCGETNGKIQITKKFLIKADYIQPSEYGAVKAIFDEVANKTEEVIVLKKIQ